MKHNDIQIIEIPEREAKEQGMLFEKTIMENISNLERGQATQVQEAQMVPMKMNPKRRTPRHIIIKMPNFKDRENLKGSKGETGSNIQGSSKGSS